MGKEFTIQNLNNSVLYCFYLLYVILNKKRIQQINTNYLNIQK